MDVSSLPLPSVGIEISATELSRLYSISGALNRFEAAVGLRAQVRDGARHGAAAHVVRLDGHVHGHRLGGERVPHAVERLDHGEVVRQVVGRRDREFMLSAGTDERTSAPPASTIASHGRRITRSTSADQKRDLPRRPRRLRGTGMRPFSIRSPSQASTAGQHGERRQDRDRDHQDRPLGEGDEGLVAGEEHARHRGDHREAGDQDGAARRRRGDLERRALAPCRRRAPRARAADRTGCSPR